MDFSMMFFFLLLGGGGNTGDLLDFTSTESYWEMRDQRVIDVDAMASVLGDEDATPIDRLMAIRTIGERVAIMWEVPEIENDPAAKAKAIKVLTPLVDSKDPFVGQYAKRSLAWINGGDPPAREALPDDVYDLDLALLPFATTHVGQMKVANGLDPIDVAALFPDVEIDGESIRDQMMGQLLPGLLQSVMAVGNARADLVTGGMTLHDEESIAFYLVVRGQYDRVGVQLVLEEMIGEEDGANFYSVGDTEVISVDNHDPYALLMPSDELFIVLFSERRGAKLPIDEVAKKLQQPDREPRFNVDIADQLKGIDRKAADIWIAMQVTKLMTEDGDMREIFGGYNSARAVATRDTEGMLNVEWFAEGSNEDWTARSVKAFQQLVEEGKMELGRDRERMHEGLQPFMDPMINMMESMTFEQKGTDMVGGMKV
ncbi:MAG: hypothetical protein AAF085_08690, partial [Planctomycetota bacterium]